MRQIVRPLVLSRSRSERETRGGVAREANASPGEQLAVALHELDELGAVTPVSG